jgi:hypothetical protein
MMEGVTWLGKLSIVCTTSILCSPSLAAPAVRLGLPGIISGMDSEPFSHPIRFRIVAFLAFRLRTTDPLHNVRSTSRLGSGRIKRFIIDLGPRHLEPVYVPIKGLLQWF